MRPDPRSMPAKRREHRSAPVRLHRYDLPGVTRFRCVRCGRYKSGSLAIEDGDLTRVVCGDCYDAARAAEQQESQARGKPVEPKAAVPPRGSSASRQGPPARRKPVKSEAAVPAQSAGQGCCGRSSEPYRLLPCCRHQGKHHQAGPPVS